MQKLNIIHVDMDAFYASIEQRDNPKYRNKPLVVGGSPTGRGVICAASYEARKYGVHSAMPSRRAKELCPNLIFLPVNMKKYKGVSRVIREIFEGFTDLIEPISIDEAFLEVSDENPLMICHEIKEKIFEKTRLTASLGLSYNKFLAKMASDMEKPDGLTIIKEEEAQTILNDMPMRKIWGVGKKTEAELNKLGIYKVRDFLAYDRDFLFKHWGRRAYELLQFCQGIDDRPVVADQLAKSMGEETTLERNTKDRVLLLSYLEDFSEKLSGNLKKNNIKCRTITVKIKYDDFNTITRSITLDNFLDDGKIIYKKAYELFMTRISLNKYVRLIGLSLSNLRYPDDPVQLSFISDLKI